MFHEQPTDPWVPFDFKLLEAYQILEDETCPLCNKPVWICRSDDPRVQFKVREATCFADRELKKWEDNRDRKKSKNPSMKDQQADFGVYRYTEAYMVDGSPLPTRMTYPDTVE